MEYNSLKIIILKKSYVTQFVYGLVFLFLLWIVIIFMLLFYVKFTELKLKFIIKPSATYMMHKLWNRRLEFKKDIHDGVRRSLAPVFRLVL